MACSWASLGSAILEFSEGGWTACATGVITASTGTCDPLEVAREIDRIALSAGCSAVAIDGPQGWRDPLSNRSFVGRLCEKVTVTPGKTGTYGASYPGTWLRWINFSIAVFDHLLSKGHCLLANDSSLKNGKSGEGGYLLLECFPTSTWRSSGLAPLKGHGIASEEIIACADQIRRAYDLPKSSVTDHHDNLQAIVCALPAAGLVGGPCGAIARGEPARMCLAQGFPTHRIEGLIWDAVPLGAPLDQHRMPAESLRAD